jgi:hypothetical protein
MTVSKSLPHKLEKFEGFKNFHFLLPGFENNFTTRKGGVIPVKGENCITINQLVL